MIGALSGGEGLGSVSSLYFPQPAKGINNSIALSGLTGGAAGDGVAQRSAGISGPGQLHSNLQQLQTQNPAKFQEIVSHIGNQLQNAAHQAQGPQSGFLSNLAARFKSVADGGSLSQLQRQQNHYQVQQAYSLGAQSPPQDVAELAQVNDS
jgi:hypothetical protein